MTPRIEFEYRVICPLCGWTYQTEIRSDFEQQIRWHRDGAHR